MLHLQSCFTDEFGVYLSDGPRMRDDKILVEFGDIPDLIEYLQKVMREQPGEFSHLSPDKYQHFIRAYESETKT